jgi:hypothetical protein
MNASEAKANAAENAHFARIRAISAKYARQPEWTAEQITQAAKAANKEWSASVRTYHRERAA